jgi:DNA-binding Xre family transcriptional regulator
MRYELIRKFITARKMTIREFCKKIEMTEAGFRMMEKGKSMSVETFEKVCVALNVSPIELLEVPPLEKVGISVALLELEKVQEKIALVKDDLERAYGEAPRTPFTPIPRDPFKRTIY